MSPKPKLPPLPQVKVHQTNFEWVLCDSTNKAQAATGRMEASDSAYAFHLSRASNALTHAYFGAQGTTPAGASTTIQALLENEIKAAQAAFKKMKNNKAPWAPGVAVTFQDILNGLRLLKSQLPAGVLSNTNMKQFGSGTTSLVNMLNQLQKIAGLPPSAIKTIKSLKKDCQYLPHNMPLNASIPTEASGGSKSFNINKFHTFSEYLTEMQWAAHGQAWGKSGTSMQLQVFQSKYSEMNTQMQEESQILNTSSSAAGQQVSQDQNGLAQDATLGSSGSGVMAFFAGILEGQP